MAASNTVWLSHLLFLNIVHKTARLPFFDKNTKTLASGTKTTKQTKKSLVSSEF
jgi:hypothetical protein